MGQRGGFLVHKKTRDELGVKPGDTFDLSMTEDGALEALPSWERPTLHSLMEEYEGPVPEFIDPGKSAGGEIW